MDETWKEIPGTDYSVSNTGKVASMKKGWRVLKGSPSSDGYTCVDLCDGRGGRRSAKVHILVAEAFLGPRPTPKHEVNHMDGVRANPRVDNLEWVTRSGNQRHRFDVLKHGGNVGETNGSAKVTEVEVREIRRRRAAGELLTTIAADFGIDQSTVSLIALGKKWGWLK